MQSKVLILISLLALSTCQSVQERHNPFRHREVLDNEGKYVLDWFADIDSSTIYFNVTVETKGFIGFGLSKKGLMLGSDIVIAGVYPNGSYYFSDRHGVADHKTEVDSIQDWTLHSAWESRTHTFLSFSRPFDTCDKDHDIPITNDLTQIIWSIGERDTLAYHYNHRGSFNAYLLDPKWIPSLIHEQHFRNVSRPQPLNRLGEWKVWRVKVDVEMRAQDTTYLCTFHKAPTRTKHHVVGVRAIMGELEKRHVHHFFILRCYAPTGIDPHLLFGRYVGHPGEECYRLEHRNNKMPTQFCQELIHSFAVGSDPLFYPFHLGVPFSEHPDEFYMIQVHYDNPFSLPGIRLNFEIETYLTSRLRENDAGLIHVGVSVPGSPSIVLPPSQQNHIIYAHCASACTRKLLPPSGINVFGVCLHTHLTGKATRVLHIQNGNETVTLGDDNYNVNYQPVRLLAEEKHILPGDMIVPRCTYDTTNRTRATVGGFSTRDEMCNFIHWYYPYIRTDTYSLCSSEMRSDVYRNFLQIHETNWSDEEREEIVTVPASNAGLKVSEVASRIKWDISNRTQLQTHHRFLPQITLCPSVAPDVVAKGLLRGKDKFQDAPWMHYLKDAFGRDDLERLTDLNKEIKDETSEFVSLWPNDLQIFRPDSICPAK